MITRRERQILECAQLQRDAGNLARAAEYELLALRERNNRELRKAEKRANQLALALNCTVTVLW